MINKQKRKKILDTIYNTFNLLDPSGTNTQMYKELFDKMSDTQLDGYLKEFFKDEDSNFYLEIEPYERELKMKDIQKALDYLGVPLFEYVIKPFDNPNGEPVVTTEKVLVGYVHLKRLQQMLSKKNTMSIHIDKRNMKTGQVIGDDKNARSSDVENIALIAIGAENTMKEFVTSRADDLKSKSEMLNKIKTDGYVSINDVSSNRSEKVALNTLDVFFMGAGIKTDLVTDGLVLTKTLKDLKDKESISSKYTD